MTVMLLSTLASMTTTKLATRVAGSWPWYVVRSAGFGATLLMLLLMVSGIGLVTGYTYRVMSPIRAWAVHRALGIAMIAAVGLHAGMLLLDHYVHLGALDVLVPFASHYRSMTLLGYSLGSMGIALGVLSLYATAIVVSSSLLILDRAKRLWKWIHYLSYLLMVMVFVHGLMMGTDLASGIWRLLWMAMGLTLVVACIRRFLTAGSLSRSRR
jgi:predicted ferric reductase